MGKAGPMPRRHTVGYTDEKRRVRRRVGEAIRLIRGRVVRLALCLALLPDVLLDEVVDVLMSVVHGGRVAGLLTVDIHW